ncbi:MAG TPA: anti-sigma factor [Thermoanaerobaculia bacterium]
MNGELTSEDLTILAALEALAAGDGTPGSSPRPPLPPRPQDADDTAEMLARLYTEALGLVPYELDPVAPSPAARDRLMSAIAGEETRPSPAAEPARVVAPPSPARPTTQEMRVQRPTLTGAAAVRRRPSRWPLALAASLVLALLGVSGWLYLQVDQERRTIARLRQDLDVERSRAAGAQAQARQLQARSLDMRQKFALVTSPAVEVSSMRPMGRPPLQPAARGVLFVAPDHQHWYLSLQGLQPAAGGKVYKLWFVADQGPVGVSAFPAQSGVPIELSSQEMPTGTKAAMITLETDPFAATPSGPEVLRAGAVSPIS